MFVIGTAGHVDHGKSTLIRAMSGIDPDRLKEEKARGMTIELGFAWVTLPSGREVSIVDVPGHERFVRNMLMGVGGIDLALLIVAADESVMPQTREHLAILDLLDVQHGIAVVTKSDLVDEEWIELVSVDVEELLTKTSLAGSPIVPVSAESGEGLPDLLAMIDAQLNELPEHVDLGHPRLPVDRAFTMSGFGAVVTGTLSGGRFRVGQEVRFEPSGKAARIRGLQSHRTALTEAMPGSRVAVNLSGIEHSEIERGDLLTTPGWLEPTTAFDASLRVIAGAPRSVRHNHRLELFAGSREAPVTVRILEGDRISPGDSGWVQIKATGPVALLKGDRFVLRDTQDTLAGGVVLEVHAGRHRRNDPGVIGRLETLLAGSGEDVLLQSLEKIEPATTAQLAKSANISEAEAGEMANELIAAGRAIDTGQDGVQLLYTAAGWAKLQRAVEGALASYHRQYPLRPGMPREELRNRLKLKAAQFMSVAAALEAQETVSSTAAWLRLPSHSSELSPQQKSAVAVYLDRLGSDRFSPPTDSPIDPELLAVLESEGKVLRAGEVVFLSDAFAEMQQRLVSHASGGGKITIQEVRELFGSSRKYSLAFLEELDRRGVTLRRGDDRFLRRG